GERGKSFTHELADSNNLYIFDAAGREPVEPLGSVGARTYCVSSPDDRHYKQFVKDHKTHFYLPVWSEEELEAARSVCNTTTVECADADLHRSLTPDEVHVRYHKWGGLPRFVLSLEDTEQLDDELRKVLRVVNLDELMKCITSMDSEAVESLSRTVVHYRVDTSNYRTYDIFIGSQYMADEIFRCEQQLHSHRIVEFLSSAAGHPAVGQIRGQIFEPFAHRALCLGGTFHMRCLEDGRVGTLTLPPSAWVQLTSHTDIDHLGDAQYGQPKSKTFAAGDAVKQPDLIFQMTGAESHTISVKGLKDIMTYMHCATSPPAGAVQAARFIFCVPPDRFSACWTQKQAYVTTRG
ncbi:hypothetical protein, partial [Silvimonas sp.]|uniref:hypothetical protein n=1 Tax=Silvimonas sp. TaxID=2650811 RepID=UPI00284F3BCF